ncbi:FGGY-family carbohydrate kinase [Oryzifoliimicrobium ureilyticus]|uniref:FGGY-family carbohydrate kinase n=1 Tax=Oryzifoliimicrobium ureilyticus TaxID=3113724 RepID=UPI0030766CF6
MPDHVVAVDVGTSSARAGVFDLSGNLLARAETRIEMNRPQLNYAEHDSEDIWNAVCQSVRQARLLAAIDPASVAAIGFDATCSLVVRDTGGRQISVSPSGQERFDTLVWLDHRAMQEADFCTATKHEVLDHSGGFMSPEMQMPKLMWLKKYLPETWKNAGYFFDLADFLTWKATGLTARSLCTLTAKWNYLSHQTKGWQADFLQQIGLDDMLEKGSLPDRAVPVGVAIGGLTADAATELGLTSRCCVASGLIDAYAGALGLLARYGGEGDDVGRRHALIAGTSSCIVAFSKEKRPSRTLWGPYYSAVFPDLWLVEAGQSAAGALLDHVVRMHAAGGEPTTELHRKIVERIDELRAAQGPAFGARLFVLPDFHGNRSPLADPHAVGVISGLTLDTSFDGLCALYWRTGVSIALGLRHILEAMAKLGYRCDTLHLAGGHVKNAMLIELYADVTGCKILVPAMSETVLLGTGMSAAVACGAYPDLQTAGISMSSVTVELYPNPHLREVYQRDYECMLAMYRHRAELEMISAGV